MSFFDEGEEPSGTTRRAPRPRRPAGGGGTDAADAQTLMVRRAVALVGGVLVLVILIFAIHSCQVSSKKRTLKEYNLNVGSLVQESDGQISKDLFRQLSTGGSAIDKQTQLNQYRIQSDDLLRRAGKLDVPGEMAPAQRQLLQVFEYRRDGIANIAAKLPTALGRQGSAAATTSIAAQMQQFLTSDVIYSQRVIPFIKQALDSAGVGGQRIQPSQFFPSLEWLSPATVASRLNSAAPGGGTGGPIAPGTHGFGLLGVSVGTVTLQPGVANRIPASSGLAFNVKFGDQGQNDEVDVKVRVTVTGAGRPIVVTKTIGQVKAGAQGTVSIPLGRTPTIGTPATIKVEVVPVPGEKKTDNNSATYPAIFTR